MMADGALKSQWAQTASVISMLVNVNRGPDDPVSSPMDFMPPMYGGEDDWEEQDEPDDLTDLRKYLEGTKGKART